MTYGQLVRRVVQRAASHLQSQSGRNRARTGPGAADPDKVQALEHEIASEVANAYAEYSSAHEIVDDD